MIKKILILLLVFIINISTAFAVTEPQMYPTLEAFKAALAKFQSSNVRIAYDEFSQIVQNSPNNDYINIVLSGKLSDIGLYNLANQARLKIKDEELAEIPLNNIDVIFYQDEKIDIENEIYLGECYADIMYNHLGKEVSEDLIANTEIREKYDYASYITALALYKSGNIELAHKYLAEAIEQNPKNISYKYLQVKLFAEDGEKAKSSKILENIKKDFIPTNFYERKFKELEEYILYKSTKEPKKRDYHLAYYYYYRQDYLRALKVMPQANDNNKKENSMIYTLISKNYLALKEYDKAYHNAQKAYKLNKKNYEVLILLGDMAFEKDDIRSALKFYKEAIKYEKTTSYAVVKVAKVYLLQGKKLKAEKLLSKILKINSNYYEAYHLEALVNPNKELQYLKKSLGLNSEYSDGWIDLANYVRQKGNLDLAQIYLNNAYNTDNNNYKYYFYQSLLYKEKKDLENARYYNDKFKSLKPKYVKIQKDNIK